MADTSELTADIVVDAQGELCPMPVIQASRALKALKAGQVLKLLATDPGSTADIPALAEALGHSLVKTETAGDKFTYWIRKA